MMQAKVILRFIAVSASFLVRFCSFSKTPVDMDRQFFKNSWLAEGL